jgi:galactose mutarotase-like enzyme
MYTIESEKLSVAINSQGAELKSVWHKHHSLEYMWSADPAFWAKTSPVLFPVVGELKDKTFRYKCQMYRLPRHGFAREKTFAVSDQQKNTITFLLESDEDTLADYPFPFSFSIVYVVVGDELSVTYVVENRGEEPMWFSVGGHPAFKLPLAEGTSYEDYKLVFNKPENAGRWPISKDGLLELVPQPLLQNTDTLPLTKELFARDAVVLKHLESDNVKLVSDKTRHGIQFSFDGFPYLGLWAAPGADFVCIEPWCGIADSVNAKGNIEQKEGINKLPVANKFKATWKVRFF